MCGRNGPITLFLLSLLAAPVGSLRAAEDESRWALVFSPKDYESLADATSLHHGAVELKQQLAASGFADDRIVFLDGRSVDGNRAATANNLRHHLSRLADTAGSDDLLFVVVAAHGVQAGGRDLVCGVDATAADLRSSGSPSAPNAMMHLQEIVQSMAISASQRRFLLIDKAGTSPLPKNAGVANADALADRFGSQPLRVPNGQWIMCSRSGRLHDESDKPTSLTCFMNSVLEGLRSQADYNENEQVSAFEISDYVQVQASSQGYAPAVLHGKMKTDFALAATTEALQTAKSLPADRRESLTRAHMRAGCAALVAEGDAYGATWAFSNAGTYAPTNDLKKENFGLYLTALASTGKAAKAFSLAQDSRVPLLVLVSTDATVYQQGTSLDGRRSSAYGGRSVDIVRRGTLLNVTAVSQNRFRFDRSFIRQSNGKGMRYVPSASKPGWVSTSSLRRQTKAMVDLGLALLEGD